MSTININQVRQDMAIAKEQAAISAKKSRVHKTKGDEYVSNMYKVRSNALNHYASHLLHLLKEKERKCFKKANNE